MREWLKRALRQRNVAEDAPTHVQQENGHPETATPVEEEIDAPSEHSQPVADKAEMYFRQALLAAARNLAHRGDQRLIDVFDTKRATEMPRPLKIGLFGNMANNSFIQARCLRRLGYSVDLILDSKSIDVHFLAQPFWEETEIEVEDQHDLSITAPPRTSCRITCGGSTGMSRWPADIVGVLKPLTK